MLRTQLAQEAQTNFADIDDLCEAICLDAVEAARVACAGIWLFDDEGGLICQRQYDGQDGRFSQGRVIPRDEAQVYLDVARQGLAASMTDEAPEQRPGGGKLQNRLDLLLVDSSDQPMALLCCERGGRDGEWRDGEIYVLRQLARVLSNAIRRHGEACDAVRETLTRQEATRLAGTGQIDAEIAEDFDLDADADLDRLFNALAAETPRRLH